MANIEIDDTRKQAGNALITALTQQGIYFTAAFWSYERGLNEWRFNLVTPAIETQGPRVLHRQAASELQKGNGASGVSWYEIDFYSPNDSKMAVFVAHLLFEISPETIETTVTNLQVKTFESDLEIFDSLFIYKINTKEILKSNGKTVDFDGKKDS